MSPARAVGPLLAVFGIVAASCSSPHATSSTAPPEDASADAVPHEAAAPDDAGSADADSLPDAASESMPPACPAGMTSCNDACADLANDPANCGACGKACSTSCDHGLCPVCSGLPMLPGPPDIPIGLSAGAITTADFDGDGDTDLAGVDTHTNRIVIALNQGNGSFVTLSGNPSSDYPFDLAAGDLDSDGDIDLVAAIRGPTASSGSVAVLLNHGDGTFADQVLYPAGSFTWSVTIADLDGNGSLDIAAANDSDDGVSVRLNHGDGTFGPEARYKAGVNAVAIEAADLDGDGDADLAVANFGTGVAGVDDGASLLFNDGTGAFGDPVHVDAGPSPQGLAVGDFDGDGLTDLAFSTVKDSSLRLLFNLGDGSFESGTLDATRARHLAAADVDGDGRVDLVAGGGSELAIVINAGAGSFLPARHVPAADQHSFAVSDLDGDHVRDIAFARLYSGAICILPGLGGGSFAAPELHPAGVSAFGIVSADWDNDGRPDLATPSSVGDAVSVLLHDSQGAFGPVAAYPVGKGPVSVSTADLDSDGDLDLVSVARVESRVQSLMNDGKGVFVPGDAIQVGMYARSIAARDVDSNGYPDLVIGYRSHYPGEKYPPGVGAPPAIEHVSLLMNQGGVFSGPLVELPTGPDPGAVAVQDIDGDALPDIVTANSGNRSMTVLRNDGAGGFVPKTSFGGGRHVHLALGDLDADGAPDAVLGSFVYETYPEVKELSVMRNDGSGAFSLQAAFGMRDTPGAVAIDDMDGDGRPDIVALDSLAKGVVVLRNLGGFAFAPALVWQSGGSPASLLVQDLNSDGRTDIALATMGSPDVEGAFAILFNRGESCGYW